MKLTLFHIKEPVTYSDGFKTTIHHYLVVDSFGIWFSRKGEEVGWIWPWKRKGTSYTRWYVTGLCSSFPTFKAIDDFWKEYFEACAKAQEGASFDSFSPEETAGGTSPIREPEA